MPSESEIITVRAIEESGTMSEIERTMVETANPGARNQLLHLMNIFSSLPNVIPEITISPALGAPIPATVTSETFQDVDINSDHEEADSDREEEEEIEPTVINVHSRGELPDILPPNTTYVIIERGYMPMQLSTPEGYPALDCSYELVYPSLIRRMITPEYDDSDGYYGIERLFEDPLYFRPPARMPVFSNARPPSRGNELLQGDGCKYIFIRGMYAGQRCGKPTGEDPNYCSTCRFKKGAMGTGFN